MKTKILILILFLLATRVLDAQIMFLQTQLHNLKN